MTSTTQILVVGTHQEITKTIARLIDKEENRHAIIAHTLVEANAACQHQNINLILIGGGLLAEEEIELKKLSEKLNIPSVNHYGGGSGLLNAEINGALKR